MGIVGYYCLFFKGFAELSAELYAATIGKGIVDWNEEMESSFNNLK